MTFKRFLKAMNQRPSESEDAKTVDGWLNVIFRGLVIFGFAYYLIYAVKK